jgi:hypothetical protein
MADSATRARQGSSERDQGLWPTVRFAPSARVTTLAPVRFAPLIAAAALALLALPASAHRSGCHVAQSCPSDHHTYVWFNAQGRGWDCAERGATEYDPSRDRTVIRYGGLTYYCRSAGGGSSSPSSQSPSRPRLGRPRTFAPRTKASGCRLHGHLPDPACTPGGYFPGATRSVICRSGYAAGVRHVTEPTKDKGLRRLRDHPPQRGAVRDGPPRAARARRIEPARQPLPPARLAPARLRRR